MSNHLKLILVLTHSLFIFIPETHAIGPVRCNGRIQFRPCEQAQISPGVTNLPPSTPRAYPANLYPLASLQPAAVRSEVRPSQSSKYFAKVLQHNFQRISKNEGLWTGKVHGNGNVQLQLQWYKSGVLHSSQPVGNIVLRNKTSSFGLRSAVPKGENWKWELMAVVH